MDQRKLQLELTLQETLESARRSFFLGEHNYSVAGPQIAYCILTDRVISDV